MFFHHSTAEVVAESCETTMKAATQFIWQSNDREFVLKMVVRADEHEMIQWNRAIVVGKQVIEGYEAELTVTRR